MKIILASKSQRRKDLLDLINVEYSSIESDCPEEYNPNLDYYHQIEEIGFNKALNVYNRTFGDRLVIGSDTVVLIDNQILGKPKNIEDAKRMLRLLSNKEHEVITSICSCCCKNNKEYFYKDYSVTKVLVDNLTEYEIDDWVNNNNVMEMAGAYAIQKSFAKHIKSFNGDYYTIVGLPLNKTYKLIEKYKNI